MEQEKAPLSLRVIYWLTNITFYIMCFATGLLLIFNVLAYAGVFHDGGDWEFKTELPVTVDMLETGNFHHDKTDYQVQLVEARTKIQFLETPGALVSKMITALLYVIVLVLFMVWKFRTFIKNVRDGKIFDIENINHLKHLAYGMFAVWFSSEVYMRVFYYNVVTNLEFSQVRISSNFIDYSWLFIGALMVWVLAHIFQMGVKLQEDKDLTI